jgi:hypothetical protein
MNAAMFLQPIRFVSVVAPSSASDGRGGHGKYYFFFFFLLRRSSRRSRRFAPATLTAEAGFPTRASVSDTVRIVPGIARPDAMPTPKRRNTLRREIKSDLNLSRIISSCLHGDFVSPTPRRLKGRVRKMRPVPLTCLMSPGENIVRVYRGAKPLPQHNKEPRPIHDEPLGVFRTNIWPSCHASNCVLMRSSAAASVLKGPRRSCRPLPHVTATYQKPSPPSRTYAIGGETRSGAFLQSMPSHPRKCWPWEGVA